MGTHTNNPLPTASTSPFLDVHLDPQCSQFLRAARLLSFLDLLCPRPSKNSSFRLLPRCPSACTLLRQVLLDWPLCWLSHCLGSALSWHWGWLEFQPVSFGRFTVLSHPNITYVLHEQEHPLCCGYCCSPLLPQSQGHVWPREVFHDVFVEQMSEHFTLISFFRVYNAYEVIKRSTANSSSQESHVHCQTDLAKSPFILLPEMLALFLQLMLRFVNFSKCHLLYKQVHIKNVFRNNLKKKL